MLTSSDAIYANRDRHFDYHRDLGLIKPQTLVMVGEHDWICPLSKSKDERHL